MPPFDGQRLKPTGIVVVCWLLALLSVEVLAENSVISPKASTSLLLDVVSTGKRLVVAGDYGHILYSDDAGHSWEQARVPTRRMLTALSFATAQRGWAVGHDGLILATVDGGQTWTLQRDGLADQQRWNVQAVEQARSALAEANRAAMQVQGDGPGDDWEATLEDLEFELEDALEMAAESTHTPPLLDVHFVNELRGVAVGAFNTLLRTEDGGVTWLRDSQALDNPDEYHLNAITGDRDGNLWIAAEGGLLFRSADAGKSWESLPSPYRGSWFGIVSTPDSQALVVFGLRGNVYRSSDRGDSWQAINTGIQRTLAGGQFINEDYLLLAGAVGTLLVSDDGGRTLRTASAGTRLHLSAVAYAGDAAVMVGQGGVHRAAPFAGKDL